MNTHVNERDFALIARDRYTFAVLDRILRGECDLVRSDHERLILCHSAARYPVWIWTPDGLSEADKARAFALAQETRPLAAGFRFNMKYELAEYFMEKGREAGLDVGYFMRLFAYDCPAPVPPKAAADGAPHCCGPDDLETAADLYARFIAAIGEEARTLDSCREIMREHIDAHALFFWKNADGKAVACCSSFRRNQGLATIGCVYTLPEHRRRHYAQHLVYHVTRDVADLGFLPMLYTDADYAASNACYEGIGYTLRGRLCTIAARGTKEPSGPARP